MKGFRLLFALWGGIAALAVLGGGTLALMGSPRHQEPSASGAALHAAASGEQPEGGPIAAPDPALETAAPDFAGRLLPAIGADGRRPSAAYAARPGTVLPGQARLALVVAGLGLDERQSLGAIRVLPPSVTLALSPYGDALVSVAEAARRAGHETLVSIPMEPAGSPLDDEGVHEIRPGAPDAVNARNLEWALSAFGGYVGATAAEAGQYGAHVANAPHVIGAVEQELSGRGLLYVEPNPDHMLEAGTTGIVCDRIVRPATVARDLDALAETASRNGAASGVAGPPDPALIQAIMDWTRRLPARGIILVPVSSLATTRTVLTEGAE